MAGRGRTRADGIRGLMLDPARLVERHAFYFDLLPRLAAWGFNTLWWHFVDDQGFVLKLRRHPELACPHAFTRDELRRFVARAGECGIDVVPEVETLGHARFITNLPQYAHLADGDVVGFNAVCPSHPDTLPLLREIIEEVAELFPSRYFHAGLDEVSFGECARCRAAAKGGSLDDVYAEHVRRIHGIVTGLGKRMVMWADHVEHTPRLLTVLPKDIVLAHWHYGRVKREHFERSLRAGFEVVGCPAVCRWGDMVQPNAPAFANLDEMIEQVTPLAGQGILGIVNTWWTPYRVVRDACLPAVAYTGHALRQGRPADKVRFLRRYLKETFGVDSLPAAKALWGLHERALTMEETYNTLVDSAADLPACLGLAADPAWRARLEAAQRDLETLAVAREQVARNEPEYDAILLSGQVILGSLEVPVRVARAYERFRRADRERDRTLPPARVAPLLDEAIAELRAAAGSVDAMTRAVAKEWDRTRYRDDVKKADRDVGRACTPDMLLGRLARSRAFLAGLLERLVQATKAYRDGGPFPGGL